MSIKNVPGAVGRVIKDHPVVSVLALFVGAAVVAKTVARRQSPWDIQLPEPTEVREADLVGHRAMAAIRDDDSSLDTAANGDDEPDSLGKGIHP